MLQIGKTIAAATMVVGGVLTAAAPVATAAPLPVTTAKTVAGSGLAENVQFYGGGYYGGRRFHGGFYGGGFGGGVAAGAALGLIGAATFGGFGPYYGGYRPYYGYGYRPYGYYARPVHYAPRFYPRRFYGYGRPYGYRHAYYGHRYRPAFRGYYY